jgi:hypothetical protein
MVLVGVYHFLVCAEGMLSGRDYGLEEWKVGRLGVGQDEENLASWAVRQSRSENASVPSDEPSRYLVQHTTECINDGVPDAARRYYTLTRLTRRRRCPAFQIDK